MGKFYPNTPEFQEDPENPGLFFCGSASVVEHGKYAGETYAGIHAYLCPACDKTHLVFKLAEGGIDFSLSLDAKNAEKIGKALINPPPADPSKLVKV